MDYVLALWSLNLAPEMRDALGGSEASVYGAEAGVHGDVKWGWARKGKAQRLSHGVEPAVFTVPKGVELVIANPHAPHGGGLVDVLGRSLLDTVRESVESRTSLGGLVAVDQGMPEAAELQPVVAPVSAEVRPATAPAAAELQLAVASVAAELQLAVASVAAGSKKPRRPVSSATPSRRARGGKSARTKSLP